MVEKVHDVNTCVCMGMYRYVCHCMVKTISNLQKWRLICRRKGSVEQDLEKQGFDIICNF